MSDNFGNDQFRQFLSNPITLKFMALIFSIMFLISAANDLLVSSIIVASLSLIISMATIIVVVVKLENRVASSIVFQCFSTDERTVKWRHIQYSYALVLCSFNVIATLEITKPEATNDESAFIFPILLALVYALEAIFSTKMVDYDEVGEIQKEEFSPVLKKHENYSHI